MNILGKDKVGVFTCVLRDNKGELIDNGNGEPLVYLHGHGNILIGMEKALEGKKAGDSISTTIDPKDAYGEYIDEPPLRYPREVFGQFFRLMYEGMALPLEDDNGEHVMFYVSYKDEESVTVTRNHPLAGEDILFTADIITVREAFPQELESKRPHGADGNEKIAGCPCC